MSHPTFRDFEAENKELVKNLEAVLRVAETWTARTALAAQHTLDEAAALLARIGATQ